MKRSLKKAANLKIAKKRTRADLRSLSFAQLQDLAWLLGIENRMSIKVKSLIDKISKNHGAMAAKIMRKAEMV
jgi:hypothetical protein